MANNVLFKKGLQAALPTTGTIENGFYLTTDTHRLYIGSNGTTALLNSAVAFYANEAALTAATNQFKPAEGDIAFVSDINALCIYKNSNWVQVNVDTDTDTSLYNTIFSNGEKIEIGEGADKKNAIKYILTVKEQDKDGAVVKNIDGTEKVTTAELIITEDMVTSLVVDVQVDVKATVETNKATIKTNGAGAAGDGFTIVGTDGITITGSEDAITIDGTTYELSVSGTTIKLTDSDDEEAGSTEIIGDNDWTAATNESGKIKVSHKEKIVSAPAATPGTITDKKFTVITGITTDKNHVTGIEKSEFTLPNTVYDLNSEEETLTLSDSAIKENYTTVIKLVDEDNVEDKVNIKTAHKITVDGTERIVKNGGDIGTFYSASEIDSKFKAVDAMTYMGPIPAAGLPTSEVKIGDTYKVTVDGTYNNQEAEIGDIFIARGEEGIDGYITDITWDYIRTGGDTDTTYALSANSDTIILTGSTGAAGSVTLGTTTKIELDAADNKITATHLGTTAAQTPEAAVEKDHGEKISVVTAVSTDDTGHATEVKTQKITLPKADKVVVTADAPKLEIQTNAGVAKGSITIDEKDGTPITVTGEVSDTNLTVTVEHDEATVGTGTDTAESVALSGAGKFTVISSIVNDGFGHLKTVKTKEITIAKETTYDLTGSVDSSVAKVTLTDSNGEADTVEFSSETLTYTSTEANKIKVELEWGTF